MLRGKSVFSVTNEDDDGWRQASQIQRRPQPRKITVGDFMTTTTTSNKYGALHDSTILSKKCRQPVQPREYKPVKAMQPLSRKAPCARTILSADEMTLDELDRVIKDDGANFVAVMQAEAEKERSRLVAVVVRSRALLSQGGATYPRTPPSQGGTTYPPTTTTTTAGKLAIVKAFGNKQTYTASDKYKRCSYLKHMVIIHMFNFRNVFIQQMCQQIVVQTDQTA